MCGAPSGYLATRQSRTNMGIGGDRAQFSHVRTAKLRAMYSVLPMGLTIQLRYNPRGYLWGVFREETNLVSCPGEFQLSVLGGVGAAGCRGTASERD